LNVIAAQKDPIKMEKALEKLDGEQIIELVQIKNKKAKNVLDSIVSSRNPELLGKILDTLDSEQIEKLYTVQDKEGRSFLHKVSNANSLELLEKTLERLSAEQIVRLGKISDEHKDTFLHFLFYTQNPVLINKALEKLTPEQVFTMATDSTSGVYSVLQKGLPEMTVKVLEKFEQKEPETSGVKGTFVLLDKFNPTDKPVLVPQVQKLVQILGERAKKEPAISTSLARAGVAINQSDTSSPYRALAIERR
jgi:predicted transcriptional regulator